MAERRYGARYSVSGMHRLLKSLDLSWMTARPQPPEADPIAQKELVVPPSITLVPLQPRIYPVPHG